MKILKNLKKKINKVNDLWGCCSVSLISRATRSEIDLTKKGWVGFQASVSIFISSSLLALVSLNHMICLFFLSHGFFVLMSGLGNITLTLSFINDNSCL